jgi:hypothetical protein
MTRDQCERGESNKGIEADEILDDAIRWLRLSTGMDRKSVECAIKEAAAFYREEARAPLPRRREARESLQRITHTFQQAITALREMDQAAFIEMCGHDDAPMSPEDYDSLLNRLGRVREIATNAQQASHLQKPDDGRPTKLAERGLVTRCYNIFEYYRHGVATTSCLGDFRSFTECVYTLATGGKEGNLERQIKYVLRLLKSEDN